jgi:hypothetical protein
MTVYSLTRISNFIDNPRIQEFHYCMFHGLAERDGKEVPHDPSVYANTSSFSPLMISRTGHAVPDISKQSSHLVVAESYRERLEQFPHIRLVPVIFRRLVDIEYCKGDDTSWREKWGDVDPNQLLRTLPDVPRFHEQIGRYYEVQTWRRCDVVDRYPSAEDFTMISGTPPMAKDWTVRVSREMLEDYPILCGAEILLNERAFGILQGGIDRDFFIVREYDF